MSANNIQKAATFFGVIALLWVALALLLNQLPRYRDDARNKKLATDVYMQLADLEIVLPVVALLEPAYAFSKKSFSLGRGPNAAELKRREEFQRLSAQAETAPSVKRIEIAISYYGSTGELTASQGICPLLTREWSKSFCGIEQGLNRGKLPDEFYLVDKSQIEMFSNHTTLNGEKLSDHIKKIDLTTDIAGMACDADNKPNGRDCIAAISTSPKTMAVWSVYSQDDLSKKRSQLVERQGKAIQLFVKYAIGSLPDFEKLKAGFDALP